MAKESLLLLLGGSIGFACSILTIYVMYHLEGLRLQRQWAREDELEQHRLRQEMDHLSQEKSSLAQSVETQSETSSTASESVSGALPLEPIMTSQLTTRRSSHLPITDDLDTLKNMLAEETRKPKDEQKERLVKSLRTSIEWFEKVDTTVPPPTASSER